MRNPFVEIGILLAESDPYAISGREIFEHYGLRAHYLSSGWRDRLATLDVLVLFGRGSLERVERLALAEWVAGGGRLLCVGGGWGVEAILGTLPFEPYELSKGWLEPSDACAHFWPVEAEKIRFFGGACAVAKSANVLVEVRRDTIGISHQEVGKGEAWFFAPHVGQTMMLMQQGRAVETDAVGPSDGSAWLTDGVLRAEDGSHLDFETDRTPGESSLPAFFGAPYADMLKELLLKLVLTIVDRTGKRAILAWPWPGGAPLAGVLSVECDSDKAETAVLVKGLLEQASIPGVWFVPRPGLPLETFRGFLRRNDEVGLLFQPSDSWNETHFRSQFLLINRMSGMSDMIAVRPDDGRWRGYTDFYRVCDAAGARFSMCKGGRQPGSTGFLFGTCHPFYPIRRDGRRHLCLELAPTIFEPGRVTPTLTSHAIIRQTSLRHGCLGITLPARFLDRETAPVALKQLQALAHEYQVLWMRPSLLTKFEKSRRKLTWHTEPGGRLVLMTDGPLKDLTLLISGEPGEILTDSKRARVQHIKRFGIEFQAIYVDLKQRDRLSIRFAKPDESEVERPIAA